MPQSHLRFIFPLIASGLLSASAAEPPTSSGWDELVGQPADVAPSAYQYRADRKPEENAPESWLALMRYADLPLNAPVDVNLQPIKRALCALLWEEIRPVRQLTLTWPADAKNHPAPEELVVTTLDNQGTASSWWNNLKAVKKQTAASVSTGGNTYAYELRADTCAIDILPNQGYSSASTPPAVRRTRFLKRRPSWSDSGTCW